jgi:hypothetical protein
MAEVTKVRLPKHRTVHLAVAGETGTVCDGMRVVEAADGVVTCRRCLRWADKRGVPVAMGWRRRVRVTVAGWLSRLAGWVAP